MTFNTDVQFVDICIHFVDMRVKSVDKDVQCVALVYKFYTGV